jgi:hypothetical protein
MDLERIYRTMLDPTECETPEVAARYFLNLPSDGDVRDSALDPGKWAALADPSAERGPSQVFAVATAPDHSWSAICVAWTRPDGLTQVMVADYRPGTSWVTDRVQELRDTWPGSTVIVDTASRGLVVEAEKPTEAAQAQAHNFLAAAVDSETVRHGNSPELNVSVRASRWLAYGNTRVLQRKGSADISPLAAAALAVHALSSAPAPEPFLVVT